MPFFARRPGFFPSFNIAPKYQRGSMYYRRRGSEQCCWAASHIYCRHSRIYSGEGEHFAKLRGYDSPRHGPSGMGQSEDSQIEVLLWNFASTQNFEPSTSGPIKGLEFVSILQLLVHMLDLSVVGYAGAHLSSFLYNSLRVSSKIDIPGLYLYNQLVKSSSYYTIIIAYYSF